MDKQTESEVRAILAALAKFRAINPKEPIPADGGYMRTLVALAERAEGVLPCV